MTAGGLYELRAKSVGRLSLVGTICRSHPQVSKASRFAHIHPVNLKSAIQPRNSQDTRIELSGDLIPRADDVIDEHCNCGTCDDAVWPEATDVAVQQNVGSWREQTLNRKGPDAREYAILPILTPFLCRRYRGESLEIFIPAAV